MEIHTLLRIHASLEVMGSGSTYRHTMKIECGLAPSPSKELPPLYSGSPSILGIGRRGVPILGCVMQAAEGKQPQKTGSEQDA